jgi:hypothetical protein
MSKIKLILEVDSVAISQMNVTIDNETFVKDLKEITDSSKIEVEKTKELIKNILDKNY